MTYQCLVSGPFQLSRNPAFQNFNRLAMGKPGCSVINAIGTGLAQIAAEASLRHADRLTSEHRRAMCTIIFDLMRADPGIRQVRDMASPPLDLRWHVNSTALRRANGVHRCFYKASTYVSTTQSPRQRLAYHR